MLPKLIASLQIILQLKGKLNFKRHLQTHLQILYKFKKLRYYRYKYIIFKLINIKKIIFYLKEN